jgi:hypothetical protein
LLTSKPLAGNFTSARKSSSKKEENKKNFSNRRHNVRRPFLYFEPLKMFAILHYFPRFEHKKRDMFIVLTQTPPDDGFTMSLINI